MTELVWQQRALQAGCSPIETAILQAIACLEQQHGKATTLAIAMRVMLSEPQTRRYLVQLEQRGMIKRRGTRGGWQCRDG
ncbi:MAG: FaeA/PapI family transcriptional regulator [Anaerolineae bacterium]|nr:FaeA/PapI family transcriptional regulator [Anaerolineae bacterium]